jgi:hypothetical protein
MSLSLSTSFSAPACSSASSRTPYVSVKTFAFSKPENPETDGRLLDRLVGLMECGLIGTGWKLVLRREFKLEGSTKYSVTAVGNLKKAGSVFPPLSPAEDSDWGFNSKYFWVLGRSQESGRWRDSPPRRPESSDTISEEYLLMVCPGGFPPPVSSKTSGRRLEGPLLPCETPSHCFWLPPGGKDKGLARV